MSTAAETSARTHKASRDTIRFTADGEKVVRMAPDGTHETFSVVEDEPVRAYKRTPTADRIPGFGDRGDSCGNKMIHFCSECGRIACDEHGEPIEIGQTCWRKGCPRCANGWAMRASITATSKIESLRKDIAAKRGESPKFHHTVVSMPSFAAAGDPDKAFKEVVKGVIDEVGINVYGGLIVHHSHSGEQGDDRGVWKERLFKERDWEGDVEDELKVRHHAHVIVLADRIEHALCEAVYDKTGITTHRIEDDNHVSLFNVEDLASATSYCLSHARVADDAYSYEYFGAVANHSADMHTEAQMRRVVRSVVPQTLDLDVGDLTCDRESDDEDAEAYTPQFDGDGSGEPAGGSDGGSTARCGGRLVPIEYAPSFLDDHDLAYADELREFYERWDGAPPPD